MPAFQNAKWIWHNAFRGANGYVNFEDHFSVPNADAPVRIRVSCDRNYSLTVNGQFVNAGQYSDYEDLKFYDELDLSPFLHAGENKLCFVVYYQGKSTSTYRHGEPGLIFEVFCGTQSLCASSTQTIAYRNGAFGYGEDMETVSNQFGYTFHYDSTKEAEREGEKGADLVEKTLSIQPRPIEKLTIGEPEPALLTLIGAYRDVCPDKTPAERIQKSALMLSGFRKERQIPSESGILLETGEYADFADGVFAVIDLGAENAGLPVLDLEVPEDCEVLVGWGEHLDDLRVRTWIEGRHFAFRYVAHAGRNTFENPLFRMGLRYLQVQIASPRARIYYAGIRPTWYPVTDLVKFSSGDHLHDHIYDVSLRTMLLCMHEHYEDCPWREQALYSMDSRNQMLCGYYAFRETRFARASIALMAHSLREDNLLELCSPAEVPITIPVFSAIFLTQLWEYFEHSGDASFARSMLACAKQIAEGFLARLDPELHLLRRYPDPQHWNFYEWQDGLDSAENSVPAFDAPLNAFVSFGLRDLARLCDSLGDSATAEHYRNAHLRINEAMHRTFYNAERGAYASFFLNGKCEHYAELTNALIVYADAVPENALPSVLQHLADGSMLEITTSHSIFKYEALLRDEATYSKYVFDDIARIWGGMLLKGATTFWECTGGDLFANPAVSFCHGWSAIPVYLYFKFWKK